ATSGEAVNRGESRDGAFPAERAGIWRLGRGTMVAAALGLAVGLAAAGGCGKKGAPTPPARSLKAPAPMAKTPSETEPIRSEKPRPVKPPPPP
ncbi:MAG: hypothetical protein IH828_09765, partial [Nitrospinae bacterium]|nr:hypothetical protein [Nitrospinota bacterium]